jgi:putative phage-type endonuclease
MAVEMKALKTHEDWLENRRKGLGGSEVAAVVGMNPYMNNVTLWELKTGRRERKDISDKPCVQYGTQAERYLRGLFRLDFPQYRVEYVENNTWKNDRFPWAKASLDGWMYDQDGRMGVLEIKTSEMLGAAQWAKWRDQIPQNYFCQCLFYMAVVEADFCLLKAQLKTEREDMPRLQTRHYLINRDDVQDDIDYLMTKGAEFWGYVERDERPPLVLPEVL